ncbi:putative 21-kDa protein [Citrus associated ampelovirus 2]|nr:putative 21-kDa protein [Citrus associated ampelovirus 2]
MDYNTARNMITQAIYSRNYIDLKNLNIAINNICRRSIFDSINKDDVNGFCVERLRASLREFIPAEDVVQAIINKLELDFSTSFQIFFYEVRSLNNEKFGLCNDIWLINTIYHHIRNNYEDDLMCFINSKLFYHTINISAVHGLDNIRKKYNADINYEKRDLRLYKGIKNYLYGQRILDYISPKIPTGGFADYTLFL